MRYKKNRVGEVYMTKEGYQISIIEYSDNANIIIQFEDGHTLKVEFCQITRGDIKNLNHRSVLGVGFVGYGNYSTRENQTKSKYYSIWIGILQRCYNKKTQEKRPTYVDCSVCKHWHNFQNFAKWYEENYNLEYMKGWHLDKDILIKGNKIYSPETCCFVPSEINMLFVKCDSSRGTLPIGVSLHKGKGKKYRAQIVKNKKVYGLGYFDTAEEAFQVYKTTKENYIKEIADKYKGLITEKCYQALINYQVEITD